MKWYDLPDAINEPFDTDAHMVTYRLNSMDSSDIPRLNKICLREVRKKSIEVITDLLVYDWDTPGHKPWSGKDFEEWHRSLPKTIIPLYAYGTKQGARIIFKLADAVPVEIAETLHLHYLALFRSYGLCLDESCSDWTRLFRLPYVTRDGEKTWEKDYSKIIYNKNAPPLPVVLPSVSNTTFSGSSCNPPATEGDWLKFVRRQLKGRECFDLIWGGVIPEKGKRDDTLISCIGQAVSLLFGKMNTTPEQVYELFLPVLKLFGEDEDWKKSAWSKVQRTWAAEQAKADAAGGQKLDATVLLESIRIGMSKWATVPTDPADWVPWVLRRLLVAHQFAIYVMTPSGFYSTLPLSKETLIAYIRNSPLGILMPTTKPSAKEGTVDVTAQSLINEYATICTLCEKVPGTDGESGGKISGLDSPQAKLILPAFRRSKLTPAYNEDVDEWMHKLLGTHYDIGCKWVAYSLAWDDTPGEICGLSLQGPQGIGKKLFAEGLAECLEHPAIASGVNLTGPWQYGMENTPYYLVDEGWETTLVGKGAPDAFREAIAGASRDLNRKHMPTISLRVPARILFTANNREVVKRLSANRDLSVEDRDALAIRLIHLDLDDAANKWLIEKGGKKLTQGWIRGSAGEDSQFTVAKHFLWLYSVRHRWAKGSRFLVEGTKDQAIMEDMRTQSGRSPLVYEALLRMIEGRGGRPGMCWEDGHLYVLVSEVLDYCRSEFPHEKVQSQAIAQVLRGAALFADPNPFVLKNRKEQGRKRWHSLDLKFLQKVAERDGWDTQKLDEMIKGTYDDTMPAASENVKQLSTPISHPNQPMEAVQKKLVLGKSASPAHA
jgi:hypothetical protein